MRSAAEGFFRHWRIFATVCASVLAFVAIFTLTAKKQYRSEMKFLLENNRSNAVITPDRNSTPTLPEITEQQINSELEVLGSEDVLGAVADPGWSAMRAKDRSADSLVAHEKRIEDFRKRLTIEPARKSTVINVKYTDSSPSAATQTLERFSNAFLMHRKQLARPSGTSSFFADEARRYQNDWQQANRDLVDFQQEHHLVSVQDMETALSKQIAAYEDDLREDQANLSAMDARFVASGKAAHQIAPRQQTQEHTIFNQTSEEQMRTVLVQLQNRREELLTRYTPQNRLVVEVDRKIADTQASLDNALAQKGHEDTTDINPAWQQVQNSMVEGGIERKGLQSKVAANTKALDDLRNQLTALQSLDVSFNALQEKADQARSNFELFSEKRDQAQVEDAMDEHKLVNIAVAETPTSSFRPVSPRPLLNAALGSLTALFLGIAGVYFAESARSTVGSARELERASQLPVLATLPRDPFLAGEAETGLNKDAVSDSRYGAASPAQMATIQNFTKADQV